MNMAFGNIGLPKLRLVQAYTHTFIHSYIRHRSYTMLPRLASNSRAQVNLLPQSPKQLGLLQMPPHLAQLQGLKGEEKKKKKVIINIITIAPHGRSSASLPDWHIYNDQYMSADIRIQKSGQVVYFRKSATYKNKFKISLCQSLMTDRGSSVYLRMKLLPLTMLVICSQGCNIKQVSHQDPS